PSPPLNLIGDFGGGAMFLTTGVLAALFHAQNTGVGQVVDCAMIDGVSALMSVLHGFLAAGEWQDARQANFLDGGAPYYDVYRCADDRWVAIGAVEPEFFALLVDMIGARREFLHHQNDRQWWPEMRAEFVRL